MYSGSSFLSPISLARRAGCVLLAMLALAPFSPANAEGRIEASLATATLGAEQPSPPAGALAILHSTYLGGSSTDSVQGITIDAAGNLYVTGHTYSSNFPGATSPRKGNTDAFVTKFDPQSKTVIYTTLLGGSDDEQGTGIAVDATGNVWVTGETQSTDFPTRNPLHQADFSDGYLDTFVTKLDANGAIEFSTYLGVAANDAGAAIALDAQGNAYVTGEQRAAYGPEVFVRKFAANGSQELYSAVFGAAERGFDKGSTPHAIAVDSQGSAYITGRTNSIVFPMVNAFQATCSEKDDYDCTNDDAFVSKLNPAGDALMFSTYLGGSSSDAGFGGDEGWSIGVDALGYVTVAGQTLAANFPVKNALQPAKQGAENFTDAFITRFTPQGDALVYSTYLGGEDWEEVHGLAVDASGNAYLTGLTSSDNFPVSADAPQPTIGPGICFYGSIERYCYDGFVTALSATGEARWSTYLGGSKEDIANAIALAGEDVVIAGQTGSSNFPTTADSFQHVKALNEDGFVVRLGTGEAPPPPPPPSDYKVFIPAVTR